MTVPRILYAVLAAATLANFAALVLWAAPKVAGPKGLLLFDERPSYTHAEAVAFLSALSDDARAAYLVEVRVLDTLFPVLLALTLALGIEHLTRGRPFPLRLAMLLPPIFGAAFDLAENASVAAMLRAGAERVTAEMAADANAWTMLKWIADLAGLLTLFVLVLLRLHEMRMAAGRMK